MALRKGKLTETEIYWIENNPDNLSLEEVASKLNRSVKIVKPHYNQQKFTPEVQSNKPKEVPEGITAGKLMGKHERGATVSTPAASEVSDEYRKTMPKKENRLNKHIHKPKG